MLNQTRVTATETNGPEIEKKRGPRGEDTLTQTSTSMFCGEEDGCHMSDGGGAWKGHVLFSSAREACLSFCRRGPRAGEVRNTAQVQAWSRYGTKVQCPIPPVELQTQVPFSSLFSEGSVSTSTSHPSSSSRQPTNHLLRPRPSFQSRRHCDLLKMNPTRAATRGERRRPDMEERGPGKVWHVIKPSPSVPPPPLRRRCLRVA